MTTQLAIAKACVAAKNEFASSHVSQAHANLIAALIENPPPAFSLCAQPSEFGYAAEYLRKIGAAFSEVARQVARDASANGGDVDAPDFSDALSDLTGQLSNAEHGMRVMEAV